MQFYGIMIRDDLLQRGNQLIERDWIRKEINYIHFLYQVRCIAIESYFVNNQSDLKAFNVSIRLFVIS